MQEEHAAVAKSPAVKVKVFLLRRSRVLERPMLDTLYSISSSPVGAQTRVREGRRGKGESGDPSIP